MEGDAFGMYEIFVEAWVVLHTALTKWHKEIYSCREANPVLKLVVQSVLTNNAG
jgi:hypothetical protein